MLKKPAKKKIPTPEYDPKRQQNVLLEQMNKSIKAIAESHNSLVGGQKEIITELETVKMAVMENSREIKGLKAGQMENSREIKGLKAGQEDLKAGQMENSREIKGLKAGQEDLKAGQMENSREIKGLKAGQEDLKAGQKSLKESLERVEKKLDTVAEDHEHRLQKLEAAV